MQLKPVGHVWIGLSLEGKDCLIQRLSTAFSPNNAEVVPSVCFRSENPDRKPHRWDFRDNAKGRALGSQDQHRTAARSAPAVGGEIDNRFLGSVVLQVHECGAVFRGLTSPVRVGIVLKKPYQRGETGLRKRER